MNFEIISSIRKPSNVDAILDNRQDCKNRAEFIDTRIRLFDDSNMIETNYYISLSKDENNALITQLEGYKNDIEECEACFNLECGFTVDGKRDIIELTDSISSTLFRGEKADEFVDKLLPILSENQNYYIE